MKINKMLCLALVLLVTACSHDREPAEQVLPDASLSALQKVDDVSFFAAYIKKGMYLPSSIAASGIVVDTMLPVTAEDVIASPTGTGFSTTNTQEQNVDEADVIKYDGEFLYIASSPVYYAYAEPEVVTASVPVEQSSGIRVMQRTGHASMTEVAWPRMPQTQYVDSLYLHQNTLVSLGSGFGAYEIVPVLYDVWYWGEPETELNFYDVSVPANMTRTHNIRISGYLETSRRIGDTLYLVTRYTPHLPQLDGLIFNENEDGADDVIQQATIEELLPEISINQHSQALLAATDCYLPRDLDAEAGYAGMVVVTAIDLTQPEQFSSLCFNAISQGIYVSEASMYVAASTQQNKTVIHKFDLQGEKPVYSASGFIDGNLGWRNPAFRMSEFAGDLRVISTDRDENSDFLHRLYVLRENAQGVLEQLSQLPNEAFPERIGKPGENITAVRYYGERAYVVTFEQTDPLYVINLQDHAAPFIEGALEIPGFSSYLHPVNDGLLLGMGWDNGVKLSLFDVSDLANPVELNPGEYVWPDAYSPIQHDYKALSFLELSAQHFRFAFPVDSYTYPDQQAESGSGLQLFDLSITGSVVSLNRQGNIPVESSDGSYRDRSIIHDDEVFYVHGNHVWSAPWTLDFINTGQ